MANSELGAVSPEIADKIIEACDLILTTGRFVDQFPVDVYQGGAGTSVNMNTNEVLANVALEIMGLEKAVTMSSILMTMSTSANRPTMPIQQASVLRSSTVPIFC